MIAWFLGLWAAHAQPVAGPAEAAVDRAPLSLRADGSRNSWESTPYVLPRLDFQAVTVGQVTTAQAIVGLEGGLLSRQARKPHWLSHTRAGVSGIYGFSAGSLGADVRAGSFFGPDGALVRWQVGPDVWFNGYGSRNALDYHLPWSPGVNLRNVAMLKVVRGLGLVGEASPGWAFLPARQRGGVGPMHELTLLGAVAIQSRVAVVTLGYQRSWNAVGVVEGFVIRGGL